MYFRYIPPQQIEKCPRFLVHKTILRAILTSGIQNEIFSQLTTVVLTAPHRHPEQKERIFTIVL